jgi:hypothetical protein
MPRSPDDAHGPLPTPDTRVRPAPRSTAAVIVVDYKSNLTIDEEVSLRHLRQYLGRHDRYLVLPQSVRPVHADFRVVTFADDHFRSAAACSRLLMQPDFYEAFLDYEYVLLYHFDALVFCDQLLEWCARDFDYIGAPWVHSPQHPNWGFFGAGNGGFSLRKVRSFLAVLESRRHVDDRAGLALDVGRLLRRSAQHWLTRVVRRVAHDLWTRHASDVPGRTPSASTAEAPTRLSRRIGGGVRRLHETLAWYSRALRESGQHPEGYIRWYVANVPFPEDLFWAFDARLFCPAFRVAPVDTALRFSFESCPETCFELNNRQLPFGCHAWAEFNRQFWEPYLLS